MEKKRKSSGLRASDLERGGFKFNLTQASCLAWPLIKKGKAVPTRGFGYLKA